MMALMDHTSLALSHLRTVVRAQPYLITAVVVIITLGATITLFAVRKNYSPNQGSCTNFREARCQVRRTEGHGQHLDLEHVGCDVQSTIDDARSLSTKEPPHPKPSGVTCVPSFLSYVPTSFHSTTQQEEAAAAPSRSHNEPLPIYVPCIIQIMLNGQPFQRCKAFRILWQVPSEFRDCVRLTEDYLKALLQSGHATSAWDSYMVSHQYRIVRAPQDDFFQRSCCVELPTILSVHEASIDTSDKATRPPQGSEIASVYAEDIAVLDAWAQRVPPKLASYLLEEPKTVFALELRLSYTTYRPHVRNCHHSPEDNCLERIRNALRQRKASMLVGKLTQADVDKGSEKCWFFPSRFLSEYFDCDLINHLVQRHLRSTINQLTDVQVEAFVADVHLWGVLMLATTIFAELNLDFFYRLWSAGKRDKDMPLSYQDELSNVADWDKYVKFEAYQHRFEAHIFPNSQDPQEPKEHEMIADDCIVPVLHKSFRGKGANGTVYKVRIHEEHHNFTPNRNEELAMKILQRDTSDCTSSHEENEVLQTLAEVPHPHLTPFYASWWHKGWFHMLFPLAVYDLHEFLTSPELPVVDSLDKVREVWLVSQMTGLAAALDHIHNLAPAGLGPRGEYRDGTNRPRTGYHLDLSLKNILVFASDVMKISDFGTARIRQLISGDFRPGGSPLNPGFLGNLEYAAPDHELPNKNVSKKHDIWSLGCIFLELLLWAFGKGPELQAFREERSFSPEQRPGQTSSAFYYITDSTCDLKSVVKDRLKWLDEAAQSKDNFANVYKPMICETRRMLKINLEERPAASEVVSTLQHLLLQAKLEISNPKAQGKSRYAPPSSRGAGDEHRSPVNQLAIRNSGRGKHLSACAPTFRSRSNSRSSTGNQSDNVTFDLQASPYLLASAASELVHSGAGADAGDTSIDAHPLRIEITDHGTSPVSETPHTPASVALQRLQDVVRPGLPRLRNNSDPRRVQTMA